MIEISAVPVRIGMIQFNSKFKPEEIDEYIENKRLNDLTEDDEW